MGKRETVVVGVDGSEHSGVAVRYALAEAARRGARVVAVRAFPAPKTLIEGSQVIIPPCLSEVTTAVESRTRRLVHELADELGGEATKVPVEAVAVADAPVRALLDRARDADLLVVGHRGRGALASAVLGSVGLNCVLHAQCPVTVVPAAPVEQRVAEPETGPAAALA